MTHMPVAIAQNLAENAVLIKDLRSRMRGVRPFVVMAANGALMLFITGLWWIDHNWTQYSKSGGAPGRDLLEVLVVVQGLIVTLLAPALTSGAFTLEREQQSFDLLLLTAMTPLQMVWGRILSVALFLLLIITSSVPFVSLCFLLGGLSPGELITQYVSLVLAAFMLSALGILCSVSSTRTPFAVAKAYLATMAFCVWLVVPGKFYLSARPASKPSPVTLLDFYGGSLHATEAAAFFNGTVPAWLFGFIIGVMIIVTFTLLAANNFPSYEGRAAGLLRALMFVLFVIGYLALQGWIWGVVGKVTITGPPTPINGLKRDPLISPHRMMANGLIGCGWLLIGIWTPFICSKSIVALRDSTTRLICDAVDPRQLFRPLLRTAIPFVFVSAACTLPLTWLAFRLGGVSFWKGGVGYAFHSLAYGYSALTFVVMATILGCLLFRPYRMVGVACGYTALVAALVLPLLPMIVYEASGSPPPVPARVDLLVLSPFMIGMGNSILEGGPQTPPRYGPHTNVPMRRWWRAGTMCYLALDLGLVLCIVACYLTMRRADRTATSLSDGVVSSSRHDDGRSAS